MKPAKTPFSYVVLRYMHDVLTREFVNVGVLLHAPRAGFLGFEKLSSLDRAKAMFPGLQSDSLRDLLRFLASRAEEIHSKTSELLDRDVLSADAVANSLLPMDDSALQWSAPGGGITDEPQQTLKELFERLVTRHLKAHPPTRRDDADVWKPFERELRQRNVLHRLQEKTLAVGELRHRFENAWQPPGGYLRLFQPLSFDLLEPSDIVEKAVRWGALIHQLRKADPDFFIYLLLGRPSGQGHSLQAFQQASETLREDTGERKELVAEDEAPAFATAIEKEIKAVPNN
ncbi:MAG: DUF3037 domain-containing protein [Verrucomicrobia bacterium]|nr:DUF3037 domain-containing protein [Verrucomicrobiota bacterium]